jgi:glycosyltransferase involved in cell wall biosynthesis
MEEHNELYNKIVDQCKFLDITENVTINRGFVSEEVLISTIRTVKVCVLPYNNHPEHDVRASSGAARTILPTSTPMVVSGVHLFDDLEGVVPRGRDEYELFAAIDDIFSNYHSNVQKQLSKRLDFIRKTSWESVAYRTSVLYNSVIED